MRLITSWSLTILYPCIPARVHTVGCGIWPSTHKQTLWQPAGHHPAHVLDCIPSSSCPGHYSALVPAHTCAACWIPSRTHHWFAHNPGTYTQLPSNLDTIQLMPGLHPVWHLHTAATGPYARGNDFGSPLIATGVVMLMHIAFCQLPPAEVIPDHGGTGHAPLGTIARARAPITAICILAPQQTWQPLLTQ